MKRSEEIQRIIKLKIQAKDIIIADLIEETNRQILILMDQLADIQDGKVDDEIITI